MASAPMILNIIYSIKVPEVGVGVGSNLSLTYVNVYTYIKPTSGLVYTLTVRYQSIWDLTSSPSLCAKNRLWARNRLMVSFYNMLSGKESSNILAL